MRQALIVRLDGGAKGIAFLPDEDAVPGHVVAGGHGALFRVEEVYGTHFSLGAEARKTERGRTEEC